MEIGQGVTIGPGCVIGYPGAIRGATIYQGTVAIGDGVTMGANVVVCVGVDGTTRIRQNSLIMNLCNIGHNVDIGMGCEIGAGTVIAGYAKIGDRVKVKIGCTIRNRVTIGDEVLVGMGSNVVSDIPVYAVVMGNPAT